MTNHIPNVGKMVTVLLLIASSVFAQTVTDTHIVGTGHTPVPRMSKHRPNVLTIPANTTQTLASGEWDVIEIAGTAKVSRTADTAIRVTDIQILPGGTLDVGSENDPVVRRVEFVFKDTPLLTGVDGALGPDPEQFGNGIAVFGQWTTHGRKLDKTHATFQPTEAGATQLTLTEAVNWQVGDSLLFFDGQVHWKMSSVGLSDSTLREESPVTIKAISGTTITLSKPLDFEHRAVKGVLPIVSNATRNIVFRSENPSGTRAHAMFMDTAHVSLHYTSFLGMGRTRAEKLDNTNFNSLHVGTNQIARYGIHWHHVHGHSDWGGFTGRIVGCYLDGNDIAKWGIVQHGTHDLLIQDNVAYHFRGAGVAAEDGFEIRGHWLNNVAAYCKGNGLDGKFNLLPENNAPGAEGAGFWFHGSSHTVEGNKSLSNVAGYSSVHRSQIVRKVPSVPGGEADTDKDPFLSTFISTKDNLAWGCSIGWELWNTPADYAINGFTALQTAASFNQATPGKGVWMGSGEAAHLTLINSKLINDLTGYPADLVFRFGHFGVSCSGGYTKTVNLDNVEIDGFYMGTGDTSEGMTFKNCRLANRSVNIEWSDFSVPQTPLTIDSCTFPSGAILRLGNITAQGGLYPKYLLNHGGKNYTVYQLGTAHPPEAAPLPGLINAVALETGETPPPPPPPPPPPTENQPPIVSQINVDQDPVYELSTVVYTATGIDPEGRPLTWVARYQYGDGAPIQWSTGVGVLAAWNFIYPAGARTYTWTVEFSDGEKTATSTRVVNVLLKPPPPPVSELEQRVAALEAKITALEASDAVTVTAIEALKAVIEQLKLTIAAIEQRVTAIEARLKNKGG